MLFSGFIERFGVGDQQAGLMYIVSANILWSLSLPVFKILLTYFDPVAFMTYRYLAIG